MANEKIESKKIRTPRTFESVAAGAGALSLADKDKLRQLLTEQIEIAWAEKQKEFEEVKKIAGK